MTWEVRNLQWNEAGNINCEVKIGDDWVPYTASENDSEEMSREIFEQIKDDPNIAPVEVIPPVDQNTVDLDAINFALTQPGSIVRALGLVMFQEINKLRVKAGLPAYTMDQFTTALKSNIR